MTNCTINTKKMKTYEIKLMIIENFIDYWALTEDEKTNMLTAAKDYVNQDHVDEIGQSLGIDQDENYIYSEIEINLTIKPSIPKH